MRAVKIKRVFAGGPSLRNPSHYSVFFDWPLCQRDMPTSKNRCLHYLGLPTILYTAPLTGHIRYAAAQCTQERTVNCATARKRRFFTLAMFNGKRFTNFFN